MEDEKPEEKIIGAEQLDEESLNNTAGTVSQLPESPKPTSFGTGSDRYISGTVKK